jgi:hypothetical protein
VSARLTVTIEVEGIDPTLVDPIEYAQQCWIEMMGDTTSEVIDADWTLLS